MKKIKAFLNSIWHYELIKFDWITIRSVEGYRSAHIGEEVEIDVFNTKEEAADFIKNYVAKIDQEDVLIFKRIKKSEDK